MPMPWYHESPAHLHVGTLENRAYYIPHATAAEALDTPEQSARCRVLEKGSAIIDLTLTVPTKEQAESICAHWGTRSQQLYAYLMQNLL